MSISTTIGGARIPLLDLSEMSGEQRRFHEHVVNGRRGQLVGPLRAAIHSPEMAFKWADFGEFVRYRTCIPTKHSELAILVCARRWNCQLEWSIHKEQILREGIDEAVVDAIAAGDKPLFADAEERLVYEYARQVQVRGKVDKALHAEVVEHWGVRGAVELTAVIGYYTLVAMTLNSHEIPLPVGMSAQLVAQDGLVDLPESDPVA